MDPNAQLSTPSPPVIMLPGHTIERETTITVECHDRAFNLVTATLDAEPTSEPLFRVEAKWGTSWSLRRKVFDVAPARGGDGSSARREHLFDLRHHSADPKNGWVVETGEGGGDGDGDGSNRRGRRRLAELTHHKQITSLGHSDIDATVRTAAGEDVVVRMRRVGDRAGDLETVVVGVDGDVAPFARIEKVAYSPPPGLVGLIVRERAEGPTSVWRARAAAGVDLTLVMVMVLCRAQMCHVWKK